MNYAWRLSRVALAAVLLTACWAHAADEKGKVTIHRDNWGVPYIFASTDADAAYGLGYAMAEDRLGDLFINIRTAVGRMSEAFGKQYVDQDYAMQLVENAKRSEEYWKSAPADLREIGDAFMEGVEAYMAEHPEDVPEWKLELHGWQTAAIGKAMIMRWPLGTIQDDLRNTQNSNGFGSNQWSVAPERSADGRAILLTDPHLTWEGMAVFYEANVFGDKLRMSGFFLVGSPMVGLGHNGNVGWAATTGGPDTADVYQLKLNPDNPLQYEYDGEYRSAQLKFINIKVKDGDPVNRPAGITHLGPLFSEPDYEKGVAYVGATPYLDPEADRLTEQFYRMCIAKDVDELYDAMGMNQYFEQNIMYADRKGNIRYTRVGRVPIRPDGYDWSMAVPGWTSETAWSGVHSIDDLVGVKNPEAGYMQNCNISPGVMMIDSPMQPDQYKDYIYNVSWDQHNSRGRRALELLSEDSDVTVDEAKAFVMDIKDVYSEEWQAALDGAIAAVGVPYMKNEDVATLVSAIQAWDGTFHKDSTAATAMHFTRQRLGGLKKPVGMGDALSEEQQTELLEGLKATAAQLKEQYGKLDVPWGEVHVVGRSGTYFPCDGVEEGGGEWGSRTLFDVGAREDEKGSGKFVAYKGSMSIALMLFGEDGIETWTCTPWGQSANPDSPHHTDQAEKLYSQRKFKRAWNSLEELTPHIESTLELARN